ncbi:MAG: tetratricopeptide repeat protein [Anaerolineae bacterium]|nr:tetratricopeptide repeat protein [Anaerolineae bacterium]
MNRLPLAARLCFALALVLVLLTLAAAPVAHAQEPTATPPIPTPPLPPGPDPQSVLTEAQRAAEDANQAMNTVGIMLNFLEVAGVVAGLLIGAAAFAGIRTINEYRSELTKARADLDAMRAELRGDLDHARADLAGLRDELTRETETMLQTFAKRIGDGLAEISKQAESLGSLETRLEDEMKGVHERADRAIRALTIVQLGEQQMEMRNWKAALRTFEEAYALDPDNRAVNYFLGELYVMQRNLRKGEEHLRRAQNDGETYPPAEAALAYALRLQGDALTDVEARNFYYSQAERRYLNAVRCDALVRDINGESVYGMLGNLYRREGRIEDAERCFEQAERITPHNCYPAHNLGMLYLSQNRPDRARPYFERVIKLANNRLEGTPSDFWARFNLVTALAALGRSDQATKELDILLEPTHTRGPLESFRGGLRTLEHLPEPPAGVEQMIARVEEAIARAEAE